MPSSFLTKKNISLKNHHFFYIIQEETSTILKVLDRKVREDHYLGLKKSRAFERQREGEGGAIIVCDDIVSCAPDASGPVGS